MNIFPKKSGKNLSHRSIEMSKCYNISYKRVNEHEKRVRSATLYKGD